MVIEEAVMVEVAVMVVMVEAVMVAMVVIEAVMIAMVVIEAVMVEVAVVMLGVVVLLGHPMMKAK